MDPIVDCLDPSKYDRMRPKPLASKELAYESNDWYNHRTILTTFCGVDNLAIPGAVQFGWQWGTGVDDEGYHRIRFTNVPVWVWNDRNKRNAESVQHRATAIGAPVLYFGKSIDQTANSRGVLAIPYHSQPPYKIANWEDYVRDLSFFAKDFGRKTVLLYYRDYGDVKQIFESFGFTVCCLGGPYATDFLPRLRRLIQVHELVVGDRVCTSAFYANIWDRAFVVRGTVLDTNLQNPFTGPNADISFVRKEFPHFLTGKVEKDIALDELGIQYMKTREELRQLFGWI